jgi:hypothetical protein
MTQDEVKRFEKFLAESFCDGITTRELRLSSQELAHLQKILPQALLSKIISSEDTGDKTWFDVTL